MSKVSDGIEPSYALQLNSWFSQAFAYEGYRIFKDKLVNEADKAKYDDIVSGVLESDWNKASVLKELSGKSQMIVLRD